MQDGIAAKHCGEVLRKLSENSKCINFVVYVGQSSQSGHFASSSPFLQF